MAVVLKSPSPMAALLPSSSPRPPLGPAVVSMNRSLGSAFLHGGVQALKVKGIQTAYSRRQICKAHGGGALGAEMNVFHRFFRIIRAYVNSILSYFEDPERMLDQIIFEMCDDLIKMRQATAEVLASQKRLEEKCKAAEQASAEWYSRAQTALAKGTESLAREALLRQKSYAETASSLKNQFDQQKMVVDSLLEKTKLLENKIHEAKSKKETLELRAQTAKTANKVNEILGNVNTSSALSAFERMEEKVIAMEYQVESINHLTTDDLERKFVKLERTSVNDDFIKLESEITERSSRSLQEQKLWEPLLPAMMWAIWRERNSMIFNNQFSCPVGIIGNCIFYFQE